MPGEDALGPDVSQQEPGPLCTDVWGVKDGMLAECPRSLTNIHIHAQAHACTPHTCPHAHLFIHPHVSTTPSPPLRLQGGVGKVWG